MHRLQTITGLLRRNPDFARLYLALLIAFAADWFATVALIGIAAVLLVFILIKRGIS